jgi:aminopeptidase YwaD
VVVGAGLPAYASVFINAIQTAQIILGCSETLSGLIREVLEQRYHIREAGPWYQSDHMIFVSQQRPAIAITSDNYLELSTHITHTEKDTPELVECQKLAEIAYGLRDIAHKIGYNARLCQM